MTILKPMLSTLTLILAMQGLCLGDDYVDAGLVKEKIDCDGKYTNGQKELFFSDLEGSRTVFRDKILTIRMNQDQVSLMGSFFQGIPKVTPASRSAYREIAEGEEYTFDCLLANYCTDGLIDGDLAFSDCKISEEDYVILDDVEDAAYWWKRVANVSDSLANETAESLFKNLSDGTMNGLQIGPSGADYTYEFHWLNRQLHVSKVAN